MVTITAVRAIEFKRMWPKIKEYILYNVNSEDIEPDDIEEFNAFLEMPDSCKCNIDELPEWLHVFNFRDFPAIVGNFLFISNSPHLWPLQHAIVNAVWKLCKTAKTLDVYRN